MSETVVRKMSNRHYCKIWKSLCALNSSSLPTQLDYRKLSFKSKSILNCSVSLIQYSDFKCNYS